jgi:hypothetical protein
MNREAYERLKPFLHRKSARNKIVLYLLAAGYSVAELHRLDADGLKKIKLPAELDEARAELLKGAGDRTPLLSTLTHHSSIDELSDASNARVNQGAYERLKPFLHRKTARNKIILYLLAAGYGVGQLHRLDVAGLKKLPLPPELDEARTEVLKGPSGAPRRSGPAFVYASSSKPLPYTDYYRLLRIAGKHAIGRPVTLDKLRNYVRK